MSCSQFLIGTGKAIITPALGTAMAGFAGREHGADSVRDDLELRVFWVDAEGNEAGPVCVICADLIGIGARFAAQVREDLAGSFGIKPGSVLLAASHTHCGPQALENLIDTGAIDPEYLTRLRRQCLEAATDAKDSIRRAVLKAGRGALEGGYAINRRRRINGEMGMAPNPEGIRDDEVTTLAFHDPQSGEVLAVLFHFTCHASTVSGYGISGDYPAEARRYVERALPGAVAGFLQGCCGDVRSNCTFVGGQRFRSGQSEDLKAFGAALGAQVVHLVHTAQDSFAPALLGQLDQASLPLEKEGEYVGLPLQRLDLAKEVSLVGLGGEPVVEYGHFVKQLRPGAYALPVGYANAVVAYIPTAHMFEEGGYETHSSCRYFGLPSSFHPSMEGVIQAKIREMMED